MASGRMRYTEELELEKHKYCRAINRFACLQEREEESNIRSANSNHDRDLQLRVSTE